MPLDLNDAERMKELVVDPLVAALRAEMRQSLSPLVSGLAALGRRNNATAQRLDSLDQRLGAIERFKLKIAAVCSLIAMLAGVGWRVAQDKFYRFLSRH